MRRSLTAAFIICALSLPSAARADDASKAEALARFNEGLALVDGGKWEEARLKFLQSLSLLRAASTYYNLASLEQKTGHELDAIEHFRAFQSISETDSRITDQQRERAKQAIADLLSKVGQIEIRSIPTATVSVDGKALGSPPTQPVPVAPGKHTVEASHDGIVRRVAVEAKAGQVTPAVLEFPDSSSPPPTTTKGADSSPSWSTARIVTVASLGTLAVAGGVLAFVFHGNAQDNVDEAKARLQGRSCQDVTGPNCTAAKQLEEDRDANVTLSTVSLIGGGVFAAAAIATAIVWPKRAEAASARVVPMSAPGFGGLGLVGRF